MSIFAVAKFLAKTRGTRPSARRVSSDSATLAGDDNIDKIPGPFPAPVATETIIHAAPEFSRSETSPPAILSRKSTGKFEPTPSRLPPPVVESRTHSDAPSSVPTDSFMTPQTGTPKGLESSLGGDVVMEEPESMDDVDLPSKSQPESQASAQIEKTPEPPQAPEPAPVEVVEIPNPEIEKYRGELHDMASQIEGALNDVHRYRTELATSSEEKDSLRKEVEAYRDELNASSLAKEGLQEELQRTKVNLSVAVEEKEGLREDVAEAKAELEEASRAKDRLNSQIQSLKEELRTALNIVDDKTSFIDRLLADNGSLKEDIRVVLLQKEELARLSEQERESIVERFNAEKEEFIRAAADDREEARREVARLKGLIAVERHSHREQHREVTLEKDDLLAKLDSEQSRISSLLLEVDNQQERIASLETRLEDSREETRELYDKHHEQETAIRKLEEELLEERDRLGLKDSQIHFLETTKESLETTLVQLQAKANETNRQNDMFQEQIRQQADQLQHRAAHPSSSVTTYGYGYADTFGAGIGRFMASSATLSAFSTFTRGLRRGASNTRAEAGVKALKLLNDEVFQLAASLTDQLETVNKRFVSDDSAFPTSSTFSTSLLHEADGVRRAKAEYLKASLGEELIQKLQWDASNQMEDTNSMFLQVALQGCLTACCMRIITSWYPSEWEYGSFLETLYERIRGTGDNRILAPIQQASDGIVRFLGGFEVAINWRKTTQQNCAPSVPRDRNAKLVDYLVEDLRAVLTIAGWSKESDADATVEAFRQKLFNIVSMAVRINTLTAVGVPGELEPVMPDRSALFDSRRMVDDTSPDRSKSTDVVPKDEIVIAVVGLGLKWAEHSEVDVPLLLMKPKVILDSALA